MSGIVLPQQVGVSVENVPGAAAFPVSVMMQQPGAIKWLTVGGISKRLLVAAMVADSIRECNTIQNGFEKACFDRADRLIAFEEAQAKQATT
jgi:hypothetical protein